MNAATRLQRVMPRLSFDERLDGMVAAYREERRADPALFETMAASDYARWNSAATILNAVHCGLGWYIDLLEAFVTQAELRLALAQQSQLLGTGFRHRSAEMDEAVDQVCLRVICEVVQRWQEVRLAELAVAHFSETLGGRQLLRPAMAVKLQGCRERLLALQDELARADLPTHYEFELPEPSADDFDLIIDLLTRRRDLP